MLVIGGGIRIQKLSGLLQGSYAKLLCSYLFTHSFIQQTFTEYLLYARHYLSIGHSEKDTLHSLSSSSVWGDRLKCSVVIYVLERS